MAGLAQFPIAGYLAGGDVFTAICPVLGEQSFLLTDLTFCE
jgi:hypothetical protein